MFDSTKKMLPKINDPDSDQGVVPTFFKLKIDERK